MHRSSTAYKRPELHHTGGGLQEDYQRLLGHLRNDALAMAQTATKIVEALDETIAIGGTASIQPQINFLTGAIMRLVKDWGAAEHMQQRGAKLRGKPVS